MTSPPCRGSRPTVEQCPTVVSMSSWPNDSADQIARVLAMPMGAASRVRHGGGPVAARPSSALKPLALAILPQRTSRRG